MSKEGRLHIGHNLSVKVEGDRLLIYFEPAEEFLGNKIEVFETLEAWQVRGLIKHYEENAGPPPPPNHDTPAQPSGYLKIAREDEEDKEKDE